MKQPLVKTKDGDFELLFQVTEEELEVATSLRDFHSHFEANPRGLRLESEDKSENEKGFRWGATRPRRRMSLPSSTVAPQTPTPPPALLVRSSNYEERSPSPLLNFCADVGCERSRRLTGKACEEKLQSGCEIESAKTNPKPGNRPSIVLKIHRPLGKVQNRLDISYRQGPVKFNPTRLSVTSPETKECSRRRGGRELDKSYEGVGRSGLLDLNKSPEDTNPNLMDSMAIQPFCNKCYNRLQTAQARQKRRQLIRMKRMFNNKLHLR
ncbi:hypothetical protein K2173_007440 [Erythroxylum novogranatense]|uniref:Uncharacterized protein n=1 Tax=Erythroxylum novogranatense TaxID=1862640 RepID=A0AAV8T6Q1_9ROSI|nr:hypothetical protein K2173_007440 [Erythroxylum novogranatense]